jgi:hypothetical protein
MGSFRKIGQGHITGYGFTGRPANEGEVAGARVLEFCIQLTLLQEDIPGISIPM